MRALVKDRQAVCRHGQLVRDFLPVEEAGRALAAIVASDVGGAVNIGSGVGSSLGELAEVIARALNRRDLLVTESRFAPNEPERMVADVSRLSGEIHYVPRRGTKEALADMVLPAMTHASHA